MNNYKKILRLLILCFLSTAVFACSVSQKPIAGGLLTSADAEYEWLLEKGRILINERSHQKAVLLFDQAGVIAPHRPEWLYEKARALFYMDRLSESIAACDQVLERDASFYDALSFGWALRLVAEKSSDQTKETVRFEIEDLLNRSREETGALMAAYEGYQRLNDREQQQKLIITLAKKTAAEDIKTREIVAARLFEQILQARNDKMAQTALLEAYVQNFPAHRHTAYAAFQFMKTKEELDTAGFDEKTVSELILNNSQRSWQKNMGVALWLIENNRRPKQAVSLLNEALSLAEQNPPDKPQFFKPDEWEKELVKQKDRIRLLLGRAWYHTGSYDEAQKAFDQVIENNRPWGDAYYYLGKISLDQGRIDEAITYFRRSLELGVRDDDAEELLGRLIVQEYGVDQDPAVYFSSKENGTRFIDVTEAAGLGGVSAKRVAWGDYDGDGFDDLLLNGNRLLRNAGNGSFIDFSGSSALEFPEKTNGGIWADYNNDGRLDLFITGRRQNHLLENTGKGVFVDQTDMLPHPVSPMQTEAAAWGDLDNDGFLDLYVANYETWGVMRAIGNHDRLYKNVNGTRFEDITDPAGVKTDEAMCGRGVTWTDINFDGFQDIVVANYRLDPNFFWLNRQSVLTESADAVGVRGYMTKGYFGHSIGPVSGDLDNDGDLDLFITNLAHPRYIEFSDVNMMLMNPGGADYPFTDRYVDSGIFFEETNSDPALADVDNDGDLDLYMTSIYPGRYSHLYLNDGKGFFTDISWASSTRVENSWGAAFADYNHDGFIDLLVASADGIHLFKNNGNANHWLTVRINDDRCNRFGIGSRVELNYGEKYQVREITAGRGTGSQDSLELVFGLGDHDGPVEIKAHTLCGDIMKKVIDHPDQNVTLTQ